VKAQSVEPVLESINPERDTVAVTPELFKRGNEPHASEMSLGRFLFPRPNAWRGVML
jgi:hypothetical protein